MLKETLQMLTRKPNMRSGLIMNKNENSMLKKKPNSQQVPYLTHKKFSAVICMTYGTVSRNTSHCNFQL